MVLEDGRRTPNRKCYKWCWKNIEGSQIGNAINGTETDRRESNKTFYKWCLRQIKGSKIANVLNGTGNR